MQMTQFHIVIPAAGSGSRMAAIQVLSTNPQSINQQSINPEPATTPAIPKQYRELAGELLIVHTLKVFLNSVRIAQVHLVLSPDDAHFESLAVMQSPKLTVHYCGGESRAQSVSNGLIAMQNLIADDDWVLVHDAARPCLSVDLLNHLLDTLQDDAVGGLLAIPLAETLKRADTHNKVVKTEPREHLWQAQTPQMFRYALLKQALENFVGVPTDEAQAIEALGYAPTLVRGDLRNLKITYPQDLAFAELILKQQKAALFL